MNSPSNFLKPLLVFSIVLKLCLGAFATRFTLVDDAYITLRYARNWIATGDFYYNPGEAVFGITTPLWGILSSVMSLASGAYVNIALFVANIALWSWAAWIATKLVAPRFQFVFLSLFLFAPCFIDNQMLGMETSLFVLLMIGSMEAALRGRATESAVFCGLLLITRPEACLFAPFLFFALTSRCGMKAAFKRLAHPSALAALLLPGIVWATFAISTYGGLIPQSMLAKTGWNAEHYNDAGPLVALWRAVPRLTFVPFIDMFPAQIATAISALLFALIGWTAYANVKSGSAATRLWLGFYLTYITFYVLGKGATEASWYAIPSSVALLFALEPALPKRLELNAKQLRFATVFALAAVSSVATLKRGTLLNYYENGYGESARQLNDIAGEYRGRVVIGEIGVYGFHSQHAILDVAALVSPEVLPMKRRGLSFVGMVRESNADWFVISDKALETNEFPSVGAVWANDAEKAWLDDQCQFLFKELDKNTYAVRRSEPVSVAADAFDE